MQPQLERVAEFHRAIGEQVSDHRALLETDQQADRQLAEELRQLLDRSRAEQASASHLQRRAWMALEELIEWIEAHVAADLTAAADALGDRLYVLLGDAVATGLPIEAIFAEIHRSNMSKRIADPETGKGKKAAGYQPPDLTPILEDECHE